MTFTDLLEKAQRGEMSSKRKYIMRIPRGVDKHGRPQYRYIYKYPATGGVYAGDDKLTKPGAQFQVFEDGENTHIEVLSKRNGKVRYRYDDGRIKEERTADFNEKVRASHATGIGRHRKMLERTVAQVTLYGNPTMQMRAYKEAAKYNVHLTADIEINPNEIDSEGREANVAMTWHPDVLPDVDMKLIPKEIENFPHPQGKMRKLYGHQTEGAARIVQAWQKGDGFLLQDEAGLGKTMTALAAMIANGGDRNLIVVPTNGRKALMAQWREAAELYGVEVQDAEVLKKNPNAKGYFIAGYNQLSFKEEFIDPATGEVALYPSGNPRTRAVLHQHLEKGFDAVSFDESHNMCNPFSETAQAGVALQEASKKALYMSATPMTNIADMHYLRKLGWFKDGPEFLNWAKQAGASITPSDVAAGDVPFRLTAPKSVVPQVLASALMHMQGSGVRRSPILTGLHTGFNTIKTSALSAQHQEAFNIAESIKDMVIGAGVHPMRAGSAFHGFQRQMWEVAKVDHAIELAKAHMNDPAALKEGKKPQVAIFTAFQSHNYSHLRSLKDSVLALGKDKDEELTMGEARKIAREIDRLVDKIPVIDVQGRITDALGGMDKVSNIHGGAGRMRKERGLHDHNGGEARNERVERWGADADTMSWQVHEQKSYQAGDKRVMVGTMKMAGTGLSFHDTVGDAPRLQINLSLPFTAVEFQQVAGRSHRLGSEGETKMAWLMGDSDTEQVIGACVAGKLKSMGSLTVGDPDIDLPPELVQAMECSLGDDPQEVLDTLAKRDAGEKVTTDEGQEAVDHFRWGVSRMRETTRPMRVLEAQGAMLHSERDKKREYRARQSISALAHTHGITVHGPTDDMRYQVKNAQEGTAAFEALSKQRTGAVYNARSKTWTIADLSKLSSVARRLDVKPGPDSGRDHLASGLDTASLEVLNDHNESARKQHTTREGMREVGTLKTEQSKQVKAWVKQAKKELGRDAGVPALKAWVRDKIHARGTGMSSAQSFTAERMSDRIIDPIKEKVTLQRKIKRVNMEMAYSELGRLDSGATGVLQGNRIHKTDKGYFHIEGVTHPDGVAIDPEKHKPIKKRVNAATLLSQHLEDQRAVLQKEKTRHHKAKSHEAKRKKSKAKKGSTSKLDKMQTTEHHQYAITNSLKTATEERIKHKPSKLGYRVAKTGLRPHRQVNRGEEAVIEYEFGKDSINAGHDVKQSHIHSHMEELGFERTSIERKGKHHHYRHRNGEKAEIRYTVEGGKTSKARISVKSTVKAARHQAKNVEPAKRKRAAQKRESAKQRKRSQIDATMKKVKKSRFGSFAGLFKA